MTRSSGHWNGETGDRRDHRVAGPSITGHEGCVDPVKHIDRAGVCMGACEPAGAEDGPVEVDKIREVA